MQICLVVIFNHKYETNIARLRSLYSSKFDFIRFIVPFYEGVDDDVISVSGNSYFFQGYIAQAYDRLALVGASHYVFIGDDLILNPCVTRDVIGSLVPGQETAYIKELRPMEDQSLLWAFAKGVTRVFREWDRGKSAATQTNALISGVNWKAEVPAANEWNEIFRTAGIERGKGGIRRMWNGSVLGTAISLVRFKGAWVWDAIRNWNTEKIWPVQLVVSYSDFFILPTNYFKQFARYCGVFASMGLFVEVAIPTALVLTGAKVATENGRRGIELWNSEEVSELETKNDLQLQRLLESMAGDVLYVHPVKLSRWRSE